MSTSTSLAVSKNRKVVHVVLLNGEVYLIHVDVKAKFQEVFNLVTTKISLREVEYFGLAFKKENEFHFVALDEKISKQSPKKWKTCQGEGYDSQNKPILTVWFRVQFYVDQVVLLREKVTRHLYYLQLKENVLNYNNLTSEEKCFQMVGYALQADYGSFTPQKHKDAYFDPKDYFPSWVIKKRGKDFILQNTPKIHQENRDLTRSDAELKYIKEASVSLSVHNLHFYHVKKKKTDKLWNTWLAVCPRGIEVYEELETGFRNLISNFLWPEIGRLYFDKKKFEIRVVGCLDGRKFTYYTDSDVTSKYLLTICRATHMFQMDIQPKLMEIRHLDAEDKRRYRESYIYSDARDLVANGNWIQHRPVKLSPSKSGSSNGNQRFSVVSDVSSNTTSGIVSDKMTISFDDSDADHGKEILIDSPPGTSTTPSTQRSKFASIISSFHNYKKSSSSSQSPVLSPHSVEIYKPLSPGISTSPLTSPGSYRNKIQPSTPIYTQRNSAFSLHSPPLIKSSDHDQSARPVTCSVSRKESLKSLKTLQPLEPRSDPSPTSPSTEIKALSLGISVLPNKPACPPSSSSAPTSFTQPFHSITTKITPDTTPSPSSCSALTPGSDVNVYHLGYQNSTAGTPGQDNSPPIYSLSFPKSPASLSPSEANPLYGLNFPSSNPGLPTSKETNPGLYTVSGFHSSNQPLVSTSQQSPPPYPMSFPSSSASATLIEQAPPSYHLGYSLGHPDIQSTTPTYINLPDPPPYSTAISLTASDKPSSTSVRPSALNEGYNWIPADTSPPKFSPGITPLSELPGFYPVNPLERSDTKLQEATEIYHPPLDFADNSVVTEIPANRFQAAMVPSSTVADANFSECQDLNAEQEDFVIEKKKDKQDVVNKVKKKGPRSVKKLHPELEIIRGHTVSFPLITALCNDTSLMQTNSISSAGSYDASTMKSTNSRLSGSSSVDTDSRRWSACCPSDTGTMVTLPSNRPKSWHSENFDLDIAQRQAEHGLLFPKSFDNHRSVPQNLYECRDLSSAPEPKRTNLITTCMDLQPMMNRYPPEWIAQQHMIPAKLNSGGLNKSEDVNIQTFKETYGMA